MPQPDGSLHVTLKEVQPFADYEIRKLEVTDVSGGWGYGRGGTIEVLSCRDALSCCTCGPLGVAMLGVGYS